MVPCRQEDGQCLGMLLSPAFEGEEDGLLQYISYTFWLQLSGEPAFQIGADDFIVALFGCAEKGCAFCRREYKGQGAGDKGDTHGDFLV